MTSRVAALESLYLPFYLPKSGQMVVDRFQVTRVVEESYASSGQDSTRNVISHAANASAAINVRSRTVSTSTHRRNAVATLKKFVGKLRRDAPRWGCIIRRNPLRWHERHSRGYNASEFCARQSKRLARLTERCGKWYLFARAILAKP